MKKMRILTAFGLAAVIAAGSIAVFADGVEELTQEENYLVSQIEETSAMISSLEEQEASLLGELDDLEAQIVKTMAGVESLTAKIAVAEQQLAETREKLAAAKQSQAEQYNGMKTRIQFLYENGGDAGWAALVLADGDASEILNKAEYTQQMYAYDRKMLEEYDATVTEVRELEQQVVNEKSSLEEKKQASKDYQARLEELQKETEKKYGNNQEELAQKQAEVANLTVQVLEVRDRKAAVIAQQEEARRQAEAQYAAYIAAQQAAYYYNNAAVGNSGGQTDAGYDAGYDAGGYVDTGYDMSGAASAIGYDAGGGADGSGGGAAYTESSGGSSTGQAVLAYAQQFLGNPYVYGGNSLTNGVDCSGFVQQVYSNFGISTSRTSWDIENDGSAVSYNDVQVGDVLCYDGHVGIYAGDGQIINAIDDAHGIGYSDAKFDQVTTIRRYV